jgi:hypothetical protein
MSFYGYFFTWGLLVYGLLTFMLIVNDVVNNLMNGPLVPRTKVRVQEMYWYLLLLPMSVLLMRAWDPYALDHSHDLEFLRSGNHLFFLFLWFFISAINALMGLPRKEAKEILEDL